MASEDVGKEQAFNIGYRTMVAVLPVRIDEFTKWLMTGTGAVAGLMVTGADKLVPVLGARGFRMTIYLLLASLGLGIVSRLLASVVIVVYEVMETMERKLSEPEDDPIEISFLAGNESPEMEEKFREEFAAPLPFHVRWLSRRLSRRTGRTPSLSVIGRLLVRASIWQGAFATLAIVSTITGILWAASSLTLVGH
ncbi:MAG: hypothetical protein WBW32_14600 [Luteibacter sp.]